MPQTNITDWSAYPPLPDGENKLLAAEVENEGAMMKAHKFGEVWKSDRLQKHTRYNQHFAIFGDTAYELFSESRDDERKGTVLIRPALIDGAAFRQFPDEGSGGVLHWLWTKDMGWRLFWNRGSGWIRVSELSMSSEEIYEHMADEADAGQSPLTGNKLG